MAASRRPLKVGSELENRRQIWCRAKQNVAVPSRSGRNGSHKLCVNGATLSRRPLKDGSELSVNPSCRPVL